MSFFGKSNEKECPHFGGGPCRKERCEMFLEFNVRDGGVVKQVGKCAITTAAIVSVEGNDLAAAQINALNDIAKALDRLRSENAVTAPAMVSDMITAMSAVAAKRLAGNGS